MVLLAVVGAGALLLGVAGTLLVALLDADDADLNRAVDRLGAAARHLPGVRSAVAEPGLGDLGTTPVDVYGDVHLVDACTAADLRSTAARIRAIQARERTFQWHPTVWCRSSGVTVSPRADVTERRLVVLARLMRDPSLRGAAVVVAQRGDDSSPDLDDAFVRVDLSVRARTTAASARRWVGRLGPLLPDATVVATTGRPGDHLDGTAPQRGEWTVAVTAGDPLTTALLRTAARVEADPGVLGGSFDARDRRIDVLTSRTSVLHELEQALPAPAAGDQPLGLSVTLTDADR